MSADGRKFRDTLRLGSDVWHDFPCLPCVKDGKNVAAVKYCMECDETLCSTCLTLHNRFVGMRVRQITDKLSSQTGQRRPDIPVQIHVCDKHGGKLVEFYCPSHDSVGCATCVNVDHSSCRDIAYIPEMAKSTATSEEVSFLESQLKELCRQQHKQSS